MLIPAATNSARRKVLPHGDSGSCHSVMGTISDSDWDDHGQNVLSPEQDVTMYDADMTSGRSDNDAIRKKTIDLFQPSYYHFGRCSLMKLSLILMILTTLQKKQTYAV